MGPLSSRKAFTLLLAALLTFVGCGGGSDGDDPPDETSENGGSPGDERGNEGGPEARAQASRPKPGAYVYDLIGIGFTAGDVPQGTRLTETIQADNNIDTVLITNNVNKNKRRVRYRWESKRVEQLSNETIILGVSRTCVYQPPVEILHLPIRREDYKEQTPQGAACERIIEVSVVGTEGVKDATGRVWTTWIINFHSEGGGRALDETRWFSPELGVNIRVESSSETSGARNETAQVLRSHP